MNGIAAGPRTRCSGETSGSSSVVASVYVVGGERVRHGRLFFCGASGTGRRCASRCRFSDPSCKAQSRIGLTSTNIGLLRRKLSTSVIIYNYWSYVPSRRTHDRYESFVLHWLAQIIHDTRRGLQSTPAQCSPALRGPV